MSPALSAAFLRPLACPPGTECGIPHHRSRRCS